MCKCIWDVGLCVSNELQKGSSMSWRRLQAALLSSVNPPVAHTQMSQSHGTDRLLWRTMGRVRMSTANQTLYGWRTWRQTELAVLWEMCQMTWRYSVGNQITYVFKQGHIMTLFIYMAKTTTTEQLTFYFVSWNFLFCFMYIKFHNYTSCVLWRCVQILPWYYIECIYHIFAQTTNAFWKLVAYTFDRSIYSVQLGANSPAVFSQMATLPITIPYMTT